MKTKPLTTRVLPEQPDHQVWQSFQMQQQQEPPNPPTDPNALQDPFAGIDLDLLDDATRAKITEAQKTFATVANQAKEATSLKAQQATMQAEIDKIRAQSNPTPLQKEPPKGEATLEDEVRSFYQEAMPGADPKVIEANVKLEMKKMTAFGNRLGNTLGQVIKPLQENDNNQLAANAFQEARQSSAYMQNDEVAEAVWAKVQNMVKNGHAPSPEIVANFAKIAHVDFMEKNPGANPNPPPPRQTMQTQQTRLTFPGAGHANQPPTARPAGNDPMDAETSAAINATIGLWPVTPKGFDKKSINNGMSVTRG